MKRTIAFASQVGGADPKLAKTLYRGAWMNPLTVAHKLHCLARSEDFSLLVSGGLIGSSLRVQEGPENA